jgi:hypothetical protein
MEVVLEADATPLVLIIGTVLRRACADRAAGAKADRLRGVFALRSAKDPQAVTMRFDRGRVELTRGVAADVDVVATVDLEAMSGPDAAKPKVTGALRHPRFALGVSKLLDPPVQPWREHALAFWAFAEGYPRVPDRIVVVCLDDGERLELGAGVITYEIHGTAAALTSIFSGGSVFGQDVLEGKVYAVGTTEQLSVLTGRFLEWTLRGA